jgi:hypothetical protein
MMDVRSPKTGDRKIWNMELEIWNLKLRHHDK